MNFLYSNIMRWIYSSIMNDKLKIQYVITIGTKNIRVIVGGGDGTVMWVI